MLRRSESRRVGALAMALPGAGRAVLAGLALFGAAWSGSVAAAPAPLVSPPLGYADIADLADAAPLVLLAEIRNFAPLEPARARGVRAGWGRVYIEARPLGAMRGEVPLVPLLRYLADVPLDGRGKIPSLKKQQTIVFARAGQGSGPGVGDEIQLIAPDAQLFRDGMLEQRIGGVLAEMAAPGAPGAITVVSEALYEQGTLAGAGETQIFLATRAGAPASISVLHRPGQPVKWSVSFSEVVDATGRPPAHDTLTWYRLACFLPEDLPPQVNVSESASDRQQAVADYRLVRGQLGKCVRSRLPG